MDNFENSTELTTAQSGEQAGVVASSQSSTDPAPSAGLAGGESGTSQTNDSGASQKSVVDSYENSDFAIVDVGEDTGEESPEPDGAGQAGESNRPPETGRTHGQAQQETRSQSAGENSAFRAVRLRAQHEAAAAARAAVDGEIASLGIPNPYNGNRPFANLQELREYSEQYKQDSIRDEAKRTGRSVQELTEEAANREFLSSLRRASTTQNAAANTQQEAALRATQDMQRRASEKKAFIAADLGDFMQKHPEIDENGLSALENNAQFRQFCGSRFGREPLANLYDDYLALVGNAGAAAVAKAAGKAAKSTGSGSGGDATLSPSQKAALDQWNKDFPEMAMSAKEFLKR